MHWCTQLGHMAASMFLSGGNYTPLHMHTQCFMCMLTQIVREKFQLLDIHTTKSQNIQSTEMLYELIVFSTVPWKTAWVLNTEPIIFLKTAAAE
jgi:hypothetical protein